MKLIAGRLNSENVTRFWLTDTDILGIGDYAIVENKNGYDLVEIIGIVETNEQYSKYITGVNVNKKIVRLIARNSIRND